MTEIEERFFRAVADSDIQQVSALLRVHPHLIEARNDGPTGETALFEVERRDVAELLIASGADVNARDNDLWTPLHGVRDPDTALLLIAHGADVNAFSDGGVTPLHNLADEPNMARLLIAHGADVTARDCRGETPLHRTAWEDLQAIEIVADEVEHIDDDTPVPRTTWAGQKLVAELLISSGADVNARDERGWTPLHQAAHSGFTEVAEILIRHGAEVDARGEAGKTPLHIACGYNHKYVASLLLQHGADTSARTTEDHVWLSDWHHQLFADFPVPAGTTPLGVALIVGADAAVEVLRNWGAAT